MNNNEKVFTKKELRKYYKGEAVFTIPNEFTKIEIGTFFICKNLKEIELPENLEFLGGFAFQNCESLEKIIIPPKVKKIEKGTFWGCTSLKEIELPGNLEFIEEEAFKLCESLEKIIIPLKVKKIEKGTFWGCTNLKEIELPGNLEVIDIESFKKCSSLKKVVIPTNTKRILAYAFAECINLEDVQLSENLEVISVSVFRNCNSLKRIDIPAKVKVIKSTAFWGCGNLEEIKIPDSISTIEENAFFGCLSLKKVSLSKKLNEFSCEVLSKISNEISYENPNFELIIEYDNYRELYKFVNFLKKSGVLDPFLNLYKERYLTVVFTGKKLNFIEKNILNSLLSNDNIKISFNDRENNVEQDKLSIKDSSSTLNLSDEIKELINEINNLSGKLPEEIKNMITQKIEKMLEDYQKEVAEKNKRPTLNFDKENINLKTETMEPEIVLLLSLKKIKLDFSRHDQLLKDLSSIYKCKNLLNTKVDQKPSELNNLEEIIQTIIYLTNKIDDKKSKELIDNVKKILFDAETKYNKDLDNLFNNDKNLLIFEEGLTNQKLKINLLNILENLTEYSKKVTPYIELLEVLKQKEGTSYKEGASIKDTIIGAKYIIPFITNEQNRKLLETEITLFCDEYIKKIEAILADTTNIKKEDYQKLEMEISKKIHPILEKLNLYSKKDVNEKDILTQLSNSITILNGNKIVEINNKKAIESFIGEIHNKIINNNLLLDAEKQEIKQRLLNIINDWLERINKIDNDKNMNEVMSDILKDIAGVDIEVNIFMKNLSSYNNKKL